MESKVVRGFLAPNPCTVQGSTVCASCFEGTRFSVMETACVIVCSYRPGTVQGKKQPANGETDNK